jgi:hypothetical protein
MEQNVPATCTRLGPDTPAGPTKADLVLFHDSYIVLLATLGAPGVRRDAALIAQERHLWLAARKERHRAIMNEALASHVHVREAA